MRLYGSTTLWPGVSRRLMRFHWKEKKYLMGWLQRQPLDGGIRNWGDTKPRGARNSCEARHSSSASHPIYGAVRDRPQTGEPGSARRWQVSRSHLGILDWTQPEQIENTRPLGGGIPGDHRTWVLPPRIVGGRATYLSQPPDAWGIVPMVRKS